MPEKGQDRDQDRPQYFEELRFAKKQQWSVAAAAVTLLAAIFVLQDKANAGPKEKTVLAILVALIAVAACAFLWMLQNHLRETRLRLDKDDADALLRGVSVMGVLLAVVLLSAGCVLYFMVSR